MSDVDQERIIVITGAGRGIGREYALEYARQGASVVVNDLGGDRAGSGQDATPASTVVEEIKASGGRAVPNYSDVSTLTGAQELVDQAMDEFGMVDTLVCNAGIIRDRSLVNMSEDEWDSVIRVHLKGTFASTQAVVRRWRKESRAGTRKLPGRLITTTSSSGLFGNAGQTNYAAAKAGIAGFTLAVSQEVARYGATANGVWPFARSRMTSDLPSVGKTTTGPDQDSDLDPAGIAPFVAWLGSSDSAALNGRFFGLRNNLIVLAEGWCAGPSIDSAVRWDVEDMSEAARGLLRHSRPNATFPMGEVPAE
jgi:NAD(P)-dependent dehydrogenase (short-subunit alcohol dehydrogenase family)